MIGLTRQNVVRKKNENAIGLEKGESRRERTISPWTMGDTEMGIREY